MDPKNTKPETPSAGPAEAQGDVQQFTHWMTEYGRPVLIGVAVAVVAVLGLSIWRTQQAEKQAAAVQALFQARAPEEFRQLALSDPKAQTAPLALATAAAEFYAQGRYDEALSAYRRFLEVYPDHMMADQAAIGVAASLEALDDFLGAAEHYEAFAAGRPGTPLGSQAVMGAARCREQLGQLEEARILYEDYIAAHPDSTWMAQMESGLLFLNKAERARSAPPPPPTAEPSLAEIIAASSADLPGEDLAAESPVEEEVPPAVDEAPAADEAPPPEPEPEPAATDAEPSPEPSPEEPVGES